jgi:signal peptidase II
MAAAPRRTLAVALAAVFVFLLDRATKAWASDALRGRPSRRLLGGALELVFSENAGGFLSLGTGLPPALRYGLFVVLVGAGLVAGAVWLLRRPSLSVTRSVAAAAVIAGGASNLLDRIVHGRVVDFAVLRAGPLHTGVFNLADAAILGGVLILLWPGIRRKAGRIERQSSGPDTKGGTS